MEAQQAIERALALRPRSPEILNNKGAILRDQDRLDDACAAFEAAASLKADYADVWSNLGNAYEAQGRLDDAEAACRRAVAIDSGHAGGHNNLGNVLKSRGAIAEATASYRGALAADPKMVEAASNVLFGLNYDPSVDDQALFDEHLGAHDRKRMEIVCYSGRRMADQMTAKLRAQAALWRPILGINDATLARQIRADAIDVLIDLSGHTAGNRPGVFALKPAPVQLSWLGYFHTTGLAQMDAVLMDEAAVPPGSERWFVETVVRLPHGRFCYTPPDYAPPMVAPPCLARGYVAFGSFNNMTKATEKVVRTWCRILQAVPSSRLILKWKTLGTPAERERVAAQFGALGIGFDRLDLRGVSEHPAMLSEYGDIDIALDPFPFSGGLTSCEALWMGLPIVTLPGSRPVSRQTLGFLRALGREDWIARDEEDYVAKAVALAKAPDALAKMRQDQRARMAAGPLCDAKTHAADVEAAIRGLWRQYCATPRT